MTLDEIKNRAVLDAIDRHGGDKVAAAAELGICLKTIYNILNRMNDQDFERHYRPATPAVVSPEI